MRVIFNLTPIPMYSNQEKFIHAFNLIPGASYSFLKRIRKYFPDWRTAWEKASPGDFMNAGFTPEVAESIIHYRKKINVDEAMEKLYKNDIFLITQGSDEYPEPLKNIHDAPITLYRKGAPLSNKTPYFAIVGTRTCSEYGEKIALRIADSITRRGCTVVSGLAIGIDAFAHYAAVKIKMPTIAVLASGISKITPTINTRLGNDILKNGGTLLSEYAEESISYKGRYLERNRIISGLCKAVIVIEAPAKSGALNTARFALEQNRDVYALVSDITRPQAKGCLNLISTDMARPVVSIDTLMEELGLGNAPIQMDMCNIGIRTEISDDKAKNIFTRIYNQPQSFDELRMSGNIEPAEINIILTRLELAGMIKKTREMKWTCA